MHKTFSGPRAERAWHIEFLHTKSHGRPQRRPNQSHEGFDTYNFRTNICQTMHVGGYVQLVATSPLPFLDQPLT